MLLRLYLSGLLPGLREFAETTFRNCSSVMFLSEVVIDEINEYIIRVFLYPNLHSTVSKIVYITLSCNIAYKVTF